MSTITGSVTKKRKKSDAKPQSQINKCLNEKRRRTQENLYIDELAELISATDMSSGKTDKCQILQRTVDQIRHCKTREGSNSHAVQQGEVSSSNPNILSNDQVNPILLEAIDGFLFVLNFDGRVEFVSSNIIQYLNYSEKDVVGKDIYNIVHHGDHNAFTPSLSPMSVGWTDEPQSQARNRTFNCRFLVKPPDDKEETMEEKQQREVRYKQMQICCALMSNNGGRQEGNDVSSESSDSNCVMCVARRIPQSEKPYNPNIEQFSIKLDTTGKIIAVDVSWLTSKYSKYLSKDLVGSTIQDLCHPHDLSKLTAHLKDALQVGEGMSSTYRLRVSSDKFLSIQTKSKLFKANMVSENAADFLMTTNSIVGDNDLTLIEGGQLSNNNKVCSGHSSNRCANNNNSNNNVGGPLMSVAHLNGQVSGIGGTSGQRLPAASTVTASVTYSESSCNPLTSLSSSNPFNHFSGSMDLGYDLFSNSSTWDLDGGGTTTTTTTASNPTNSRPPSRPTAASPSPQGTFSTNTPPPPPPPPTHCSPMRAFSPTSVNAAHTFGSNFSPYSPLQESSQSSLSSASNANGAASARSVTATGTTTPTPGSSGAVETTENSALMGSGNASTSSGKEGKGNNSMDTSSSANSTGPAEAHNSVVSTESGRLRNLLTKGSSASDDSQDNANNDSENQNKHRILKILLNQQDEDDFHIEHKVRTSPNSVPKSSGDPSKSLGNNMLLQLLNEKTDDEDEGGRAGLKKRDELLQQLLKDDEERKIHQQQSREEDPLLRSLGFRDVAPLTTQQQQQQQQHQQQSNDHAMASSNSQIGQKRPGEEGELNMAIKRPMDGSHQVSSSGTANNVTSRLWEKNKMLASLLAKQPSQQTTIPPIPASVISATPQDKLLRVADRLKPSEQQLQQQQSWTSGNMQSSSSNVTTTATTTTTTSVRTCLQNQSRQLPRQAANIYLSHMLSQQRTSIGQMEQDYAGEYRHSPGDPIAWDNLSSDPDLSEILDQVIEFVPDEAIADSSAIANLLDAIEAPQNNVMNEKMAINAIQKSLMQCENVMNPTSSSSTIPGTPPAYSTALGSGPSTTSHNYQAPPIYQQQQQAQQAPRMRFSAQQGIRQVASQLTQQQQVQLQQRSKLIQQHQQQHQQQQQQQQQQLKQRLLQQQQQQQLLIPSNATATDQIAASGIHNIDSLLNNTVAPNVSLQRSSVSDSQVSPGYGGSVQMPSGHRLAHSYSHPTALNQHASNNFNSGQQVSAAARLSPHSPANLMSFSHPQPLSPRVAQQTNYGNSPRLFNVNQVRPQQPQSSQQQQQQQRSMPSPGTATASSRQSPFPAEAFPPPASPTASQFPPPVPNPNVSNPSTQYRLQRTTSTPSATTQLPGGVGSPRHYGTVNKEQPLLSPSHPHPAAVTHNQHSINNSQHFSNSQHPSMMYHGTGNTINTADVPNNQYCYDRTSVPLYPSGPGDTQDPRPVLSSNNPASHQIGGNAGNAAGMASEYVRQELRAVVRERTQQHQQRVPSNLQNNLSGQVSQDDLEALGLQFQLSPSAGETVVSDGPAKSWAIGSAGSAPSSSRSTLVEQVPRGDSKSSLLQKLLSE